MTRTSPRRVLASLAIAALALGLLAACGGDDNDATSDTTGAFQADDLEIALVWARTSPTMATAGAVYLRVTNETGTDDALLTASVDPSVAAKAELHETRPADGPGSTMGSGAMAGSTMGSGDMTGSTGDAPMMEMVPVDRIPVPTGGTVALEPGGYHIMLLELAKPLEVGSTIDVTLTFERAGQKVVSAEVRDTAP